MKRIKLLVVCSLIFGMHVDGSFKKDTPRGKEFCLDLSFPVDHEEEDVTSPLSKKNPSEVGFYSGNWEDYFAKLRVTYTQVSCQVIGYNSETNEKKSIDLSSKFRFDHMVQDALIQEKISDRLGVLGDLHLFRNQVRTSKNVYKTIVCFGLNYFLEESYVHTLPQETLPEETSTVRGQVYVALKCSDSTFRSNLKEMRNSLMQKAEIENSCDPSQSFVKDRLHQAYADLQKKVSLQYEIDALQAEKRYYQPRAAAVVCTAVGLAGYFYATKK